jgi:hypothetical protein
LTPRVCKGEGRDGREIHTESGDEEGDKSKADSVSNAGDSDEPKRTKKVRITNLTNIINIII